MLFAPEHMSPRPQCAQACAADRLMCMCAFGTQVPRFRAVHEEVIKLDQDFGEGNGSSSGSKRSSGAGPPRTTRA